MKPCMSKFFKDTKLDCGEHIKLKQFFLCDIIEYVAKKSMCTTQNVFLRDVHANVRNFFAVREFYCTRFYRDIIKQLFYVMFNATLKRQYLFSFVIPCLFTRQTELLQAWRLSGPLILVDLGGVSSSLTLSLYLL